MDKDDIARVKVVLVGTPNSGKTTLFNSLTGLNQKTGNFPGVTVERKSSTISLGEGNTAQLVDLPGTNTLYPNSEDEGITYEVLCNPQHPDHPDIVVLVADGSQLNRGLLLCTQVMELGIPMVLAVNMMDLLSNGTQEPDLAAWAQVLEIPVIGISARNNTGIHQLKKLLTESIAPPSKSLFTIPSAFRPYVKQLQQEIGAQSEYLAFQALVKPQQFPGISLDTWKHITKGSGIDTESAQSLLSNELLVRNDFIKEAEESIGTQRAAENQLQQTRRLDALLTHRIGGYLVFFILLGLIFQAIFSWATYPMDWIEGGIAWLISLVQNNLPAGFFTDLLTEGVITGFGGIIVFIPQIAFLFFFIALMEESGYMARVVFLMDRIMRPFGFSGKSVIPLMGGMACAIPSIMMTRNIPNKTERLITILVTPLMSCSARIPVYILLIAMFVPEGAIMGLNQRGLFMTGLYALGFVAALGMAFVFKKLFRYASDGMFVMEMPVYRMPRWRNVGLTVFQKSMAFVFGAGKIILGITIVLWLLVSYGPGNKMAQVHSQYEALMEAPGLSEDRLEELNIQKSTAQLEASYAAILGHGIEPLIRPLGYDWKIGVSLITSFAAREVFVGTMSIIYGKQDPEGLGSEEAQESGRKSLIKRMQSEKDPETGEPIYTMATVLSLLIFYVFAMQCMSTLAVTRKEAGWKWTMVMLLYLTGLAYICAYITYQVFS